jgi:flagellar biosynthetic protein FliR
MIGTLVANFRVFLIILVRVTALIQIAPLFSSQAFPQTAKLGFALFVSAAVYPWVARQGYVLPSSAIDYFLVIVGEAMIGIILGFFLNIIFAVFQVAGQFFSLQMGFGASEVFDPLAQIEIPLMGQFLNIAGMFTFLVISGAQKLLLVGVYRSFQSIRAADLVAGRSYLLPLFLRSLGDLFVNSLTISFPILGTLLLVSVTMGLLAKAAPQMNLLMMGFPVAIGVALIVIAASTPFLIGAFSRLLDNGFEQMGTILSALKEAGG